jgi:hypothetical protein
LEVVSDLSAGGQGWWVRGIHEERNGTKLLEEADVAIRFEYTKEADKKVSKVVENRG